MQTLAALAGLLPVVAASERNYSPEALDDEISSLPGAPEVPFRMFSGYIDVSAEDEKAGSRQMFYWFIEAEVSPEVAPVMLWTNGGPGCSGLGGFLSEQGPFRATAGGKSLTTNDFAWNKLANIVFIEQPVGVGFSKTELNVSYGDEQAAADNHRFVLGFFRRYSQYASHDFFISSESYGGHYMPTLARKIKSAGDVPQFRGIFLGNPLTYMMYRNYGQYGTAWGHQLLPSPLWSKYEQAGCTTTFPPSPLCSNITQQMDAILAGFDPYALDFDKCQTPAATGRHERYVMRNTILKANAAAAGSRLLTQPMPYQPCAEDYLTEYLNRADVQAAVHVAPGAKWSMCSDVVSEKYNTTDVNEPMMPVWKELLAGGDLRIMIYSGDDDSVCATLGSQQFVWNLGYPTQQDQKWAPWKVDGQVAGFMTDFEVPTKNGNGGFSFVTVHGAGHMVPATQPARSFALLKTFLGMQQTTKIVV